MDDLAGDKAGLVRGEQGDANDRRLEVPSGDCDGGHGWELLKNPATGEEFGPVAAKVAAFLTQRSRSEVTERKCSPARASPHR